MSGDDWQDRAGPEPLPASTEATEQQGKAVLNQEERNWGMFCHIAVLAGFVVPFGNIVGPLVLWLMKKDQMPFVDYNGKEVINFQLTVLIAVLVSSLLIFLLIGVFLLWLIAIAVLVMTIIGAVKASQGEYYRYPLTFRFIK